MPLGVHVSVAGGLCQAFSRGEALRCTAIQIFVKNPNRWLAAPLGSGEVKAFLDARARSSVQQVVAHAGYLLNLCAEEPNLERSIRALIDEAQRCLRLRLDGLIVHPGAHLGAGEAAGIRAIANSLTTVLGQLPEGPTRLLLEVTAGQGSVLGYRLEHLADVLSRVPERRRLGICLDTCHLHAAGFDLASPDRYVAVMGQLERLFSPGEVACLHLNDSKHPLGSRRDRHANLGTGTMGLQPFRNLLHDPRWTSVPMILETPAGEKLAGHRADLETLRSLQGGAVAVPGGPGRQ